jgi:hypothetical protein
MDANPYAVLSDSESEGDNSLAAAPARDSLDALNKVGSFVRTDEDFRKEFYRYHELSEDTFLPVTGQEGQWMYSVAVANIRADNQTSLEEVKVSILMKIGHAGIKVMEANKFNEWTPALHLKIKGNSIDLKEWKKASGSNYSLWLVKPTLEPYTASLNWYGLSNRFSTASIGPSFNRLLELLGQDNPQCLNVPVLGFSVGQSKKSPTTKAWITYTYLGRDVAIALSNTQQGGVEIGGTTLEVRVKWTAQELAAYPVLHFTSNQTKLDCHGQALHWASFIHAHDLHEYPYAFLKSWTGKVCGILLFVDSMEELSHLAKKWGRKVSMVAGKISLSLTAHGKAKKYGWKQLHKTPASPTGDPPQSRALSTRMTSKPSPHNLISTVRPLLTAAPKSPPEPGDKNASRTRKTSKGRQYRTSSTDLKERRPISWSYKKKSADWKAHQALQIKVDKKGKGRTGRNQGIPGRNSARRLPMGGETAKEAKEAKDKAGSEGLVDLGLLTPDVNKSCFKHPSVTHFSSSLAPPSSAISEVVPATLYTLHTPLGRKNLWADNSPTVAQLLTSVGYPQAMGNVWKVASSTGVSFVNSHTPLPGGKGAVVNIHMSGCLLGGILRQTTLTGLKAPALATPKKNTYTPPTYKQKRKSINKWKALSSNSKRDLILAGLQKKWALKGSPHSQRKVDEWNRKLNNEQILPKYKLREGLNIMTLNIQGGWQDKTPLLAHDLKTRKIDILLAQETHLEATLASISTDPDITKKYRVFHNCLSMEEKVSKWKANKLKKCKNPTPAELEELDREAAIKPGGSPPRAWPS